MRAKLICETAEQIDKALAFITQSFSDYRIKDRFVHPKPETHYACVNIKARMDNGHVCEIQIVHNEIEKLYDLTHDDYARIQELNRKKISMGSIDSSEKEEKDELEQKTQKVYDDELKRAGLFDRIIDFSKHLWPWAAAASIFMMSSFGSKPASADDILAGLQQPQAVQLSKMQTDIHLMEAKI